MKELIFLIAQIAEFLTKNFETFKGKTLKQIRMNCKKYFTQRFWELIGVREDQKRDLQWVIVKAV